MDFRLAKIEDLKELKLMFNKITKEMQKHNNAIWDDVYPYICFEDDIENKKQYVLVDNNDIVASFAISNVIMDESNLAWSQIDDNNVLYLERLGVNVEYLRRGMGSLMLDKAIKIAHERNVKYLRLHVLDYNEPAIKLYLKKGFKKVEGIYNLVIDEDTIFHEYGFELEIK